MSQSSQFALLKQRRFGPFFWTQFMGAFNDNVFKTALLTVLTYEALSWTTLDSALLNNLIPGLFILPFLVFSATAGQLADKFEKSRLARYVKVLEIAIMVVAAAGWMTHSLWLLVTAVVGMGVHSTLFGPVNGAGSLSKAARSWGMGVRVRGATRIRLAMCSPSHMMICCLLPLLRRPTMFDCRLTRR